MIVTVNPSAFHANDSRHALNFARRCRTVALGGARKKHARLLGLGQPAPGPGPGPQAGTERGGQTAAALAASAAAAARAAARAAERQRREEERRGELKQREKLKKDAKTRGEEAAAAAAGPPPSEKPGDAKSRELELVAVDSAPAAVAAAADGGPSRDLSRSSR